jgi:hypothetical protein
MAIHYTIRPYAPAKSLPFKRPAALFVVLAVTIAAVHLVAAINDPRPNPIQDYRAQLSAQVDTETGAPRSGRDPAVQIQTSLAAAASQPIGTGLMVEKPAAGVVGTPRHVQPSDVIPDLKKTRVLASGCLLDYGKPGEQCLPPYIPGNTANLPDSCAAVRRLFPAGIQVSGRDSFGIDKNSDKVACGNSDLQTKTPARGQNR